jgi:transposase
MVVQVEKNFQKSLPQSPKTGKKSKSRMSKSERIHRKTLKILRGQTENFDLINPNAAGIDIGSEQIFVAVPADRDPEPVRMFRSYTEDLHHLADWLISCNITSVVMESTGVYWIPLFQILESRGLKVCLVNARHVKNLPGRKTDVLDCQWLQKLHTFGLLAASFRPPDEICVLRSFIRQRGTLIVDAGRHVQHMQKALTEMNVLVHKAVTDITGKTGMTIIEAILKGERNPLVLASHRDSRCKKDEQEIAKALTGDFRHEHLFVLKQAYQSWCHARQQMIEIDGEIEKTFGTFDRQTQDTLKKKKTSKPKQNEVNFDLANYLYQITGVDLTEVYGISCLTTMNIISEIGIDVSPWRTSRHFCSWLGLCPNNKISGGKILGVRTRKVANRVAKALRLAAKSLQRSQNALGAFFRRMAYKLGYQEAVTATAHKLARIIYAMLKYKRQFDPLVLDIKHEFNEAKKLQSITKIAKNMGYKLMPISEAKTV